MFRKVDRILVRVPQVDSAARYYRDALGVELLRQGPRVAHLRMGEVEVVLHSDPDLPEYAVYYLVDDVREMYRRRAELRLQFAAPPSQVSRGFSATIKDPWGNVMNVVDRAAPDAADVEDVKAAGGGLFAGVEHRVAPRRQLLVKLYEKVGRTADDLPYTPHFESLYAGYVAEQGEPKPTRGEVWRHLLNLRKAGKLPRMGEARSQPPPVPNEDRQRLRDMLGDDIGRRDRLPYSDRFDRLVDDFNRGHARPLSPHLVWRLVATLAK